ncbi:MAG: flagellar filament capping protein FliD [Lachnospiraceae bacterium]|nr:flagellar filament capping protein FliD [Lachnospiraceae bacterium]
MALRLSGLISGMDTESLISQLVEARGTKVKTAKKAQVKAGWKEEAWKDLNTKLKNLQSKYISNLRFASSYSKKTTKVSDSSKASVITGEAAVNSVQSLQIGQLAKTGYLTGAEMKGADGETKGNYTALTTMSELGLDGSGSFSVKTGTGSVDINFSGDTTISDALTKMKDAGLNASFDAKTQRFFISAKESGSSNDFSITASDANGAKALSKMGLQVGLKDDAKTLAQYKEYASYYDKDSRENTIANMRSLIDSSVEKRRAGYESQYNSYKDGITSAQSTIDSINEKYAEDDTFGKPNLADYASELGTQIDAKKARQEELQTKKARGEDMTGEELGELESLEKEIEDLSAKKSDAESVVSAQERIATNTAKINELTDPENGYISVDGEGNITATAKLIGEEEDSFYNKAQYASKVMAKYNNMLEPEKYPLDEGEDYSDVEISFLTGGGATKVTGQDAEITLNGAKFTNSSNVFDINGLTITALAETKGDETVTLTTENDTDGIYDMVKNFIKEYNNVVNEMDKLYNAESAKGYEPLLSEEKEAMSDSEVEEYEKKIKSALLKGDSNLSNLRSGITGIMMQGFSVKGTTMYLNDFGINTLGYFNAADNEKNALHIDGDTDDDNTSGNADKLKGLIASDPDTVVSFFTQLAQSLYGKMSDLSKSVDGYRSFGSFYDDKKMKSDYTDYTSKISDLEQKLNDYEDKWYSKFSKMESAMAKMQSKTNALSGILGG